MIILVTYYSIHVAVNTRTVKIKTNNSTATSTEISFSRTLLFHFQQHFIPEMSPVGPTMLDSKKHRGMHNKETYTRVYTPTYTRIDLRVYTKYNVHKYQLPYVCVIHL